MVLRTGGTVPVQTTCLFLTGGRQVFVFPHLPFKQCSKGSSFRHVLTSLGKDEI